MERNESNTQLIAREVFDTQLIDIKEQNNRMAKVAGDTY
jgi:hypothetical protein